MLTRVISGAVLIVLTLILIFAGNTPLAVVLMLLSLSAFHELAGACGLNGREENKKRVCFPLWDILGLFCIMQ